MNFSIVSSSCFISEPYLLPGLRRTSYSLQQYSVNRKTSLSLRPVDRKLLAPAFAYTCTGLTTCKFTVRSEKRKLSFRFRFSCKIAIRLLDQLLPLYPDFSGSRHVALGGIPVSYRRPSQYPAGFFPHTGLPVCGRLLLQPEGLYLLMHAVLRHEFTVGGFRLPRGHHCTQADLPSGYPRRFKLSISPRLEALARFIALSWSYAWFRYGIFKVHFAGGKQAFPRISPLSSAAQRHPSYRGWQGRSLHHRLRHGSQPSEPQPEMPGLFCRSNWEYNRQVLWHPSDPGLYAF